MAAHSIRPHGGPVYYQAHQPALLITPSIGTPVTLPNPPPNIQSWIASAAAESARHGIKEAEKGRPASPSIVVPLPDLPEVVPAPKVPSIPTLQREAGELRQALSALRPQIALAIKQKNAVAELVNTNLVQPYSLWLKYQEVTFSPEQGAILKKYLDRKMLDITYVDFFQDKRGSWTDVRAKELIRRAELSTLKVELVFHSPSKPPEGASAATPAGIDLPPPSLLLGGTVTTAEAEATTDPEALRQEIAANRELLKHQTKQLEVLKQQVVNNIDILEGRTAPMPWGSPPLMATYIQKGIAFFEAVDRGLEVLNTFPPSVAVYQKFLTVVVNALFQHQSYLEIPLLQQMVGRRAPPEIKRLLNATLASHPKFGSLPTYVREDLRRV